MNQFWLDLILSLFNKRKVSKSLMQNNFWNYKFCSFFCIANTKTKMKHVYANKKTKSNLTENTCILMIFRSLFVLFSIGFSRLYIYTYILYVRTLTSCFSIFCAREKNCFFSMDENTYLLFQFLMSVICSCHCVYIRWNIFVSNVWKFKISIPIILKKKKS